jgi:polysaccharide export outer membrane protein
VVGRRAAVRELYPRTARFYSRFTPFPYLLEFSEYMHKLASALLLVTALSACGGRQPLVTTQRLTVVQDDATLPPPNRNDLTAADRPSLVGPLDTIQIDVFNVPDLSREIQVDSSGRISMPLAGTIDARGKTAAELADAVEGALRGRYIRNPEVTVNIKSSVSQVVTIDGQVIEPGLYPVTNQMTLLRAIASAKGFSEFARQEEVVILRTANGKKMAGLYNVEAIRRGAYDDPPIYANDVIVVGDSPERRLFRDFVSLSPILAAPLIAILQ